MIELMSKEKVRAIFSPERLAIIETFVPPIMWSNEEMNFDDGAKARFIDSNMVEGGTLLVVELEGVTMGITFPTGGGAPILDRVQKRTVMKPVEVWEVIQKFR